MAKKNSQKCPLCKSSLEPRKEGGFGGKPYQECSRPGCPYTTKPTNKENRVGWGV